MSKQKALNKYTVAGIADVLGCFGVPTSTAMQIYQDILDKRAQDAIEILFSEIRQGNFSDVDQNDAVNIIARFQRDAIEGVARNNLRLMARVINGMAEKGTLKAPSFLKYATVLASLTEDEITVLSAMIEQRKIDNAKNFDHLKLQLDRTTPKDKLTKNFGSRLEPIQQALIRTGLISMTIESHSEGVSHIDLEHDGAFNAPLRSSIVYCITSLMDEILRFVPDFKREAA